MTFEATDDGVHDLIEAMLDDHDEISVDNVTATPWGTVAGFTLEGVSFEQGEIVLNGEIVCVNVGEEDFRQSHFLRIDCGGEDPDADEDDDATLPECIMVGLHTMAEASDESCQATYRARM